MSDTWKSFVEVWNKRRETTKDPVFRFLCSFISFNYILTATNKGAETGDIETTKRLIVKLIMDSLDCFAKANKPFSIDYESSPSLEIMKSDIKEGLADRDRPKWFPSRPYGELNTNYRQQYADIVPDKNDLRWSVVDVFLKIYIVRNNLFHGWKTPAGPFSTWESEDNSNLKWIDASDKILQQYLSTLFEYGQIPNISEIVNRRQRSFINNERTRHEIHRNHDHRNFRS